MKKVKAIIKRPSEPVGRIREIDVDDLVQLQKIVGGYIEWVPLCDTVFGDTLGIICNEEGKLLGLPYNMSFCGITFVGTIIALGICGDSFDEVPVSLEEWEKLLQTC